MLSKRETVILKLIEDEIHAREEEIVSGSLDRDQYKDMTGFVRGLRRAAEFVMEIDRQDN